MPIKWNKQWIADEGYESAGVFDVNNDGVLDIVSGAFWYQGPDPNPVWGWAGSVPMLVEDINGDGQSELVVGNAHGYGLWWVGRANGVWQVHPIDPYHAQYHDMQWIDIDGDGQKELVTGKRHRAHCGNEAGEWDSLGIYYFKWTGEGFAKHVIDYGPIGQGQGCGIHFAVADLRGTGRLDLVAPGKESLVVYFNEGRE